MSKAPRDHGGGLDGAAHRYGGERTQWIDLSTGINPVPYPIEGTVQNDWTALPDAQAFNALEHAARRFWNVPDGAGLIASHGASAIIARLPALMPPGQVDIPTPTYNEHAAAFEAQGWTRANEAVSARVLVHPNNPDGRMWNSDDVNAEFTVIDESFCDIAPSASLIETSTRPNTIILKSFGKFWGLAGLRLGFAIGDRKLIERLAELTGPWSVSGPALRIGAAALQDVDWAQRTRQRLAVDATRLDALVTARGARLVGGTSLFRLYDVGDAKAWQDKLAKSHIWSRIFPYSDRWLRLGLPAPDQWKRVERTLMSAQ